MISVVRDLLCISFGAFFATAALAIEPAVDTVGSPAESTSNARAPLPLWEIGIAAAAVSTPDYPGADRNRLRALPLPYAIYRGRTLRADDDGVRSRYKFSPTAELDVSFGGALPADSDGNRAREDMPDLDLLLEVGPQVTFTLARPTPQSDVRLAVPARAAFSTDFSSIDLRGFIFEPQLSYARRKVGGSPWSTIVVLSSTFATKRLHRYFYEVEPRFATAGRPAYEAHGGYLESSLTAGVQRSFFDRLTLFSFVRASSLQGARNADSPLLRDDLNFTTGIGLTYVLRRSTATVSSEDER